MELVDILQSCQTEEDFYNFFSNRLAECIEEGYELSDDYKVIGDNLEINPEYSLNPNSTIYGGYDINVYWQQFIPPDVKIVFGVEFPFCTNGYYYYMDDFDYILSFMDYIYDKEINEEVDLIAYIHKFLFNYFVKPLEQNDRQRRHQLLCDKYGMYYPPSKEHSILDFKGNSTAMCTEFGAVAQNLMSFFGLETIYIHDKEHAYNIVQMKDNVSVVDFSQGVYLYNDLDKTRTYLPFIADIEGCVEDILQRLVSSDYTMEFNDYRLYRLGNIIVQQNLSKKRTYGSGGYLPEEKKIIK